MVNIKMNIDDGWFYGGLNWSKAVFKQQNPCSNHEIHVSFEHGFWPTSLVNATRRDVMRFVETNWPTLKNTV